MFSKIYAIGAVVVEGVEDIRVHSFFIRTKFIRTPSLRLFKKTKNNFRL